QARNLDCLLVQASEPDKRVAERGCSSRSEVDVVDLPSAGFFCTRRRDVAARRGCERHDSDDEAPIDRSGQHVDPPSLVLPQADGTISRPERLSVGCLSTWRRPDTFLDTCQAACRLAPYRPPRAAAALYAASQQRMQRSPRRTWQRRRLVQALS